MNHVVLWIIGAVTGFFTGYLCAMRRLGDADVAMENIKKQEREMKELRIKMESCLEKLKKAQSDIEKR